MSGAQPALFGPEVFKEYAQPVFGASRVMLESGAVGWCSPERILAPVRELAGGPIAFDPFSNPYSLVAALRSFTLAAIDGVPMPTGMEIGDSLQIAWPRGVTIYDNPPFGDEIEACAAKISAEARLGSEIVSTVPARIDTTWFQEHLRPPVWCAIRGRVAFLEPVTELDRRFEERRLRAIAANQKPPSRPKYRMVGPYLAESDPAPFALVMAYHGPRIERFVNIFSAYGRIYSEVNG